MTMAVWGSRRPRCCAPELVDSVETLHGIAPDSTIIGANEQKFIGVVAPSARRQDTDFELRAFFPEETGILREDPVTGSVNASVAQWLIASGRATAPSPGPLARNSSHTSS